MAKYNRVKIRRERIKFRDRMCVPLRRGRTLGCFWVNRVNGSLTLKCVRCGHSFSSIKININSTLGMSRSHFLASDPIPIFSYIGSDPIPIFPDTGFPIPISDITLCVGKQHFISCTLRNRQASKLCSMAFILSLSQITEFFCNNEKNLIFHSVSFC